MNEVQIEPIKLWSTLMFEANYVDHQATAPELHAVINRLIESQKCDIQSFVATKAKNNLKESAFDFLDTDDQYVQNLKFFLIELISTVAYEVNHPYWPENVDVHCEIIESWFHDTQNGGYHDVHSHPNCSWCGIYFLDKGESKIDNGQNRFYDPRSNADHYQDSGTAYLGANGIWDIEPCDGQVIIFPSYLKHSAIAYFGKISRRVVAFNAQIHIE
ncbi:putative 2OG-Fe(II) oxygenase [Marinicellulosiphila megalodicopiae]|uniref:putative 2OG-Fe(II) oxygenase n=1 Tax=Marinicellulosiphila megalodicopiae TaxID=2724896 RepID=UPI003BAE44CC